MCYQRLSIDYFFVRPADVQILVTVTAIAAVCAWHPITNRSACLSLDLFRAFLRVQMLNQEFFHSLIKLELVLIIVKAMAFVVFDNVLDLDTASF